MVVGFSGANRRELLFASGYLGFGSCFDFHHIMVVAFLRFVPKKIQLRSTTEEFKIRVPEMRTTSTRLTR
jgi:hypothetical protein